MKTQKEKIQQAKLLSYQQLISLYDLNRFDWKTKDQIIDWLIRKFQKESGHIWIYEK